ncbi:MAG: hypothetical protein CMG46_02730 [Candidatus Marinimicrobia bacterium]|nr:hypothetical protein [Candidatus Neomarinimicrobiota bacterium]
MNKLKSISFLDTINYKIGYQLYLFIRNNKNHSHLIIYGGKKSGKSHLVQSLFRELYDGEPILNNNEHFRVLIHKNYYLFDCNAIYNKQQFIEYLKNIVKTFDYYSNQSKYIILLHFEKSNEVIQNSLRVIVEKGSNTSKIIFVTNKINKIIPPLRSRCVDIRIPVPCIFNKYLYLKDILETELIPFNKYLLMQLCKKYELETIIHKYIYIEDNLDLNNEYSRKVQNIIYEPDLNVNKINFIRKLSSDCKEVNISLIDIFKQLIDSFRGTEKEQKIIHEISKYDSYLQHSYRDLIHYESLIISVNSIINDI